MKSSTFKMALFSILLFHQTQFASRLHIQSDTKDSVPSATLDLQMLSPLMGITASGDFYLVHSNPITLLENKILLAEWLLSSPEVQRPESKESRSAALKNGRRSLNDETIIPIDGGMLAANVTALIPKRARKMMRQRPKDYPGANCHGAALQYLHILHNSKYVAEKEYLFFQNSPLCEEIVATLSNPPPPGTLGAINYVGSHGRERSQHAFIYIGKDLVFEKDGPTGAWRIISFRDAVQPYSAAGAKQHPFLVSSFYRCKSADQYLLETRPLLPNRFGKYRKFEATVHYLEKEALDFERNEANQSRDRNFRTRYRLAIKRQKTLGALASLHIADMKMELNLPQKELSDFRWESLIHRLDTLALRPAFHDEPETHEEP
jgi:hypothetical protein